MTTENLFWLLGLGVVCSPTLLVAVLGLPALIGRPLSENATGRWTYSAILVGFLSALGVLAMMLLRDAREVPIDLGNLVVIRQQHFHFHLKFVFDRLSVPFVILSFLLCGTIGAFTNRYLHRESGYGRFYLCYALFTLGMVVTSLAGTIEVLFFGWELVGLSSALLVAFYHERPTPVRNGLYVWSVYRMADAAFLIAAVALHHMTGAGDFDLMMGAGPWPDSVATLEPRQAFLVGLLLLFAAAGKSALVPFSGWLPRAMEGPTPSSAIFYGALSVHLGAFLLLRVSPLLEISWALSAAVVVVGATTAILAALAARVQTDIKTALSLASLTQVGVIVAEIGLSFRYIALIHIIGHACLRTLQLLRAPSLLHDYHSLENAIGDHLRRAPMFLGQRLPFRWQTWLYRVGMERGFLDTILDKWIVFPFLTFFRKCDALEAAWTDWLAGGESRESDDVAPEDEIVEELRL